MLDHSAHYRLAPIGLTASVLYFTPRSPEDRIMNVKNGGNPLP